MILGINNTYRQKLVKPENTKIMIIKQFRNDWVQIHEILKLQICGVG